MYNHPYNSPKIIVWSYVLTTTARKLKPPTALFVQENCLVKWVFNYGRIMLCSMNQHLNTLLSVLSSYAEQNRKKLIPKPLLIDHIHVFILLTTTKFIYFIFISPPPPHLYHHILCTFTCSSNSLPNKIKIDGRPFWHWEICWWLADVLIHWI